MSSPVFTTKTYAVEHLDPELGDWSKLEYINIAEETASSGSKFLLTSFSSSETVPEAFKTLSALEIHPESVEKLFTSKEDQVCLLDPSASQELSPEDGEKFSIFLFGGILGDDPPRDRTAELRKLGYSNRRLGPAQMTTDTAVRVTRLIIENGKKLDGIDYVDDPELKIDDHESVVMPFRYVKATDGSPILPEGMFDLIKKDSEKGFGELI